jgi:CheY-like chemotaxis protein
MPAATHHLCVLVVDDHESTAQILAEYLRGLGYDAFPATSGEQALALADEHRPECVLLDLHMPGMNGVELGRQLRRKFRGEVTLIAMTGEDAQAMVYKLMLAICDHVMTKPVDLDQLKRVLSVADPDG